MAGDWIKMRSDLYRDPKVSVIADALMDEGSELSEFVNQNCQRDMTVTRNVMRNVTVGALVSVWGVMRQRGKRNGDGLACDGVTLRVLDDIADLPGFGDAMAQAGWVVETPTGIEFPRFFEEYNTDPTERTAQKSAERQRRYRERQKEKSDGNSDVTRDVTVTHREEKNREENISASAPPKFDPMAELKARGVDEQVARDWIDHRKTKKAKVTPTVIKEHIAEANKAGLPLHRCLAIACRRGWTGFEADWLKPEDRKHEDQGIGGWQ